ncbi:hypothetical protein BDF21DRAFT_421109 [Thamnidium elegans]|nr:hypothetical protein BDF21DRAFT_421109 [Thamnidium elegans]
MNGFNSIDPFFGNGSSTKKLSDGTPNSNPNMGSPRTAQLATIGKTDWQRTRTNKLESNKLEIIYLGGKLDSNKLEIIYSASNYGNDATRIADHSQQHGEGRKIDNGSIADNAGNYHGRNNTWMVEMREEAPVSTRKKKSYHTEQISCNLNDLVLGLKSPIIQSAISKMEEEGSQCNSRSSTSSSSPIPNGTFNTCK